MVNDTPHITSRRAFIRNAGTTAAAVAVGSAITSTKASARTIGANDRIGFGQIGCGGEGNALMNLVHNLKASANVQITAVCDVYRPRLEKAATKHKAKPYTDYRELLADPNVDVVGIATPDHIHGRQAIDAITAGKDVYCEKPVTHWRQFELTKQLYYVVKKSDRILQLGTQYMSESGWHQARKLVQDGAIGQPIHAECGLFRVGDWGERGMPIDDPNAKSGPDLNWEAFLGDAPKRPFDVSRFFRWRMYWDYAGGPATDLYPHCLTQVLYVLGVKLPATVVATGGKFRYEEREVPDTFNMLIDYPEKITVATLGTQGNGHPGIGGPAPGRAPVIRGWDGTITFEGGEVVVTPGEGSQKKPARARIERPYSHTEHMANFLACCRSRQQPYSPMDLAYYTQTTLQMAILSLREGKVARFDRKDEKITLG
jgi:predicted dehydrogenase